MLKFIAHRRNSQKGTPRRRERARAGFTLMELLAALAILTVLGTIVASAMVTASRVMATMTAASNAAVLEQSIETALSDVLRYASAQVSTGQQEVSDPAFDTDSYFDYAGSVVRNGHIQVEDGKIALVTSSGVQYIPKAAGIYTDFVVSDLVLSYDCASNVFTATYTISTADGSYSREGVCVCRSLLEETNQ